MLGWVIVLVDVVCDGVRLALMLDCAAVRVIGSECYEKALECEYSADSFMNNF